MFNKKEFLKNFKNAPLSSDRDSMLNSSNDLSRFTKSIKEGKSQSLVETIDKRIKNIETMVGAIQFEQSVKD